MANCKILGTKLKKIISFGKMPIANAFIQKNNFDKEFFFEMEVGFSEKLSLLQLLDHPKPEMMFNENYPFFTSSSKSMINHFKNYASWLSKNYGKNLKKIIEIGSNDGTFLNNFVNSDIKSVGFEPSLNVSNVAKKNGINSINHFFNLDTIYNIQDFVGSTDVISAANVICHIPDLNNLFKAVDKCLNKKGILFLRNHTWDQCFKKFLMTKFMMNISICSQPHP